MSDGLRLLSAALVAASASAVISTPVEMFLPEERPPLDFIRQHFRQYRELPEARTVQEETGVRLPAATEALGFYVDRVYERFEYNQIRDRFAGLRDGLASMNMTAVSESIADMHRVTRQRNRRGREIVNLEEAANLVQDRLTMTRGLGGVTGIESGWALYDSITGGYQNGDLISLVGRPSTGKTYILLRQAWKAYCAGHSVLFVTTEMGAEQIGRRHVSIALGVNPTHLRMNTVSTHVERRIREFYRGMAGVDRFRIFSVGINSQVSAIEAFAQEYEPDFIVVDGGYLLRPSNGPRNMNRTERITGVLDELKGLTLEINRPLLLSTQFSRAAGKGGAEGSLEDIGYTDAIGTHSSIVVATKFGPTTNPRRSRWLEFMKGREGEEGRVAINFNFAPLNMDEFIPDGEETADGTSTAAAPNVDWMV